MYEKIYNSEAELINIKKNLSDRVLYIPLDQKNSDYKKYLEDIEEGVEVIDNPPSQSDVEKSNALSELQKADQEVIKNIARVIEDYYDVMPADQQEAMYQGFKDAIANKKIKRKAYTDLL